MENASYFKSLKYLGLVSCGYYTFTFMHFPTLLMCLLSVICGGALNATSTVQTLTSPSFPSAYPPYTSCRWILDAPPQETIKVSIQTFVLQPSQSCSTNYLEMKDWPTVSPDRDWTRKCCIICKNMENMENDDGRATNTARINI